MQENSSMVFAENVPKNTMKTVMLLNIVAVVEFHDASDIILIQFSHKEMFLICITIKKHFAA